MTTQVSSYSPSFETFHFVHLPPKMNISNNFNCLIFSSFWFHEFFSCNFHLTQFLPSWLVTNSIMLLICTWVCSKFREIIFGRNYSWFFLHLCVYQTIQRKICFIDVWEKKVFFFSEINFKWLWMSFTK